MKRGKLDFHFQKWSDFEKLLGSTCTTIITCHAQLVVNKGGSGEGSGHTCFSNTFQFMPPKLCAFLKIIRASTWGIIRDASEFCDYVMLCF